jgi:hypothetical protein
MYSSMPCIIEHIVTFLLKDILVSTATQRDASYPMINYHYKSWLKYKM